MKTWPVLTYVAKLVLGLTLTTLAWFAMVGAHR